MLKEFKAFAMRGNAIDMAVGIIIGTAFGKIITSLVNDVIMPPIGLLMGRVDFSHLVVTLQKSNESHSAVTLNYGLFINTVLDFIIVAFAIFMMIRQLNRFSPPAPSESTTKECTECCSSIPLKARKCPHCASTL